MCPDYERYRAELMATSQDHERSATYSRKFNAALWFYDRDQLDECAESAQDLLDDPALPVHHRMRILILLALITGGHDAEECRIEAEQLWRMAHMQYSSPTFDEEEALTELRTQLDALKVAQDYELLGGPPGWMLGEEDLDASTRRFPFLLSRWCYDLNRSSWRPDVAILWLNLVVVKQAASPVKRPVYRRIRQRELGGSNGLTVLIERRRVVSPPPREGERKPSTAGLEDDGEDPDGSPSDMEVEEAVQAEGVGEPRSDLDMALPVAAATTTASDTELDTELDTTSRGAGVLTHPPSSDVDSLLDMPHRPARHTRDA
ncbi:hypothetical protein LTR91_012497 [Friedmanniomyces endolithicus]|uniref:Uncharacterized protein n=1 Tax=Friedmanniomyces endolithicus TaxID=329885 RepID=A0AAN6KFD4_9PEZI|nr:hypothetical protein LTR01_005932 [Friedmanniomyces endolithicus]KAK0825368.1 hypothetical protein LTR73_006914 [Friedmanniomyces endolithicus]KAK0921980.1 hypothetical protein LTR57_008344 [Friedmanniomyces endolithicus]KAK0966549.1 hypothetical protein LTS01_017704 [Friedmanniomyces endolithicus]KAK0979851.1 hypothetical protein LTR91_012497 [Friedmanniomyces endolithicus]